STEDSRYQFNYYSNNERTIMCTSFNAHVAAHQVRNENWYFKSPAVGVAILELGKLQLYETYYDKLLRTCPSMRLLYTDTDSFIVKMNVDPNKYIADHPEIFNDQVGSLKDEGKGVLFIASKV